MIIRENHTFVLSWPRVYFALGISLIKLSRTQYSYDFKKKKKTYNFDFFRLNLFFGSRIWLVLGVDSIFNENII